MKKVWLGLGLCVAVMFTSCKSSESAYKKAYEKAKAQQESATTSNVADQNQVAVTPVNTNTNYVATTPVQTTTAPVSQNVDNAQVRSESVTVIKGAGLKQYSVVCGSFGLQANAEGLQNKLKNAGYDAQVVYNAGNKMYRVVATTFADKAAAVQSRDALRGQYNGAWLLYAK